VRGQRRLALGAGLSDPATGPGCLVAQPRYPVAQPRYPEMSLVAKLAQAAARNTAT
jgi:hypothetical protein